MRAAVGMLLDAEWSNLEGCFVQKKVINGIPTHCYFDKKGNYLPNAPMAHVKKRRRPPPSGMSFWSQKIKDQVTTTNRFANVSTSNSSGEDTQDYDDILFGQPVPITFGGNRE